MPLGPDVRYRWTTVKPGAKVRLAFKDGEVVEAKSKSGSVHSPAEFAADHKRREKKAIQRALKG